MANENVNKVTLGSETLIDITDTTAEASDVASGKVFYAASGARSVGTASGGSVFYGTCATAAATQAKAVVCEEFASSDLAEGTAILVKFANAQTYNGAPTLNVNSTGAVAIKRFGTTNAARYEWLAGETLMFVHDGANWVIVDGGIATTTYYGATKLATSAVSTSTALAATPASINNLAQQMLSGAAVYSASATYAVGDRVRYGYLVYECNTAITTAEAWTAEHWTALDPLQEQVDSKASLSTATVTLEAGSSATRTVSVAGVTATNTVIVAPDPAYVDNWVGGGWKCTAQGAGTLTFKASSSTAAALYGVNVNVVILG